MDSYRSSLEREVVSARSTDPNESAKLVRLQLQLVRHIRKLQSHLIARGADPKIFASACEFFLPQHYVDVVVERRIQRVCGYPCCKNELPTGEGSPRWTSAEITSRYKASKEGGKVFSDAEQMVAYCSRWCYAASVYVLAQCSPVLPWARVGDGRVYTVEVLTPQDVRVQRAKGRKEGDGNGQEQVSHGVSAPERSVFQAVVKRELQHATTQGTGTGPGEGEGKGTTPGSTREVQRIAHALAGLAIVERKDEESTASCASSVAPPQPLSVDGYTPGGQGLGQGQRTQGTQGARARRSVPAPAPAHALEPVQSLASALGLDDMPDLIDPRVVREARRRGRGRRAPLDLLTHASAPAPTTSTVSLASPLSVQDELGVGYGYGGLGLYGPPSDDSDSSEGEVGGSVKARADPVQEHSKLVAALQALPPASALPAPAKGALKTARPAAAEEMQGGAKAAGALKGSMKQQGSIPMRRSVSFRDETVEDTVSSSPPRAPSPPRPDPASGQEGKGKEAQGWNAQKEHRKGALYASGIYEGESRSDNEEDEEEEDEEETEGRESEGSEGEEGAEGATRYWLGKYVEGYKHKHGVYEAAPDDEETEGEVGGIWYHAKPDSSSAPLLPADPAVLLDAGVKGNPMGYGGIVAVGLAYDAPAATAAGDATTTGDGEDGAAQEEDEEQEVEEDTATPGEASRQPGLLPVTASTSHLRFFGISTYGLLWQSIGRWRSTEACEALLQGRQVPVPAPKANGQGQGGEAWGLLVTHAARREFLAGCILRGLSWLRQAAPAPARAPTLQQAGPGSAGPGAAEGTRSTLHATLSAHALPAIVDALTRTWCMDEAVPRLLEWEWRVLALLMAGTIAALGITGVTVHHAEEQSTSAHADGVPSDMLQLHLRAPLPEPPATARACFSLLAHVDGDPTWPALLRALASAAQEWAGRKGRSAGEGGAEEASARGRAALPGRDECVSLLASLCMGHAYTVPAYRRNGQGGSMEMEQVYTGKPVAGKGTSSSSGGRGGGAGRVVVNPAHDPAMIKLEAALLQEARKATGL